MRRTIAHASCNLLVDSSCHQTPTPTYSTFLLLRLYTYLLWLIHSARRVGRGCSRAYVLYRITGPLMTNRAELYSALLSHSLPGKARISHDIVVYEE